MYDGLDRDDIYIMVEDEFHAVARTFTQHLHHAEYVRLKNEARVRNASTLSTISRPTDSITALRAETKRKKEAEARDAKNKAILERLKGTRVPRPTSDDSDLSPLEEKEGEHWQGTALQGLMTTSPKKGGNSLTGLQGVKSSTRAAAGYSKSEPRPTYAADRPFDLAPRPSGRKKSLSDELTADETDDDDLDAPAPMRHTSAIKATEVTAPRASSPNTVSNPRHSLHLKPKEQSKKPPPLIPKPPSSNPKTRPEDDFVPHSSLQQTESARRRLKARIAREEADKEAKRKSGGNVDEIPVFLY